MKFQEIFGDIFGHGTRNSRLRFGVQPGLDVTQNAASPAISSQAIYN